MIEFKKWPKTPRLFRDITITEKIDGTNAAVIIQHVPDGPSPKDYWDDNTMTALVSAQPEGWMQAGDFIVAAQSRNRIITPTSDNAGFALWVWENAEKLVEILGEGYHYGEWWGSGIQRGYGMEKGVKHFSLFNAHRHAGIYSRSGGLLDHVPTLYQGPFSTYIVNGVLDKLEHFGSTAAPGFKRPEGIVVYHSASKQVFKALLESDDKPKGLVA